MPEKISHNENIEKEELFEKQVDESLEEINEELEEFLREVDLLEKRAENLVGTEKEKLLEELGNLRKEAVSNADSYVEKICNVKKEY